MRLELGSIMPNYKFHNFSLYNYTFPIDFRQINRKSVITSQVWFDLTRFKKDFPVRRETLLIISGQRTKNKRQNFIMENTHKVS